MHVNPADAVRIHRDIGSIVSVGIHWGTFPLSTEHYLEPRDDLKRELYDQGLDLDKFIVVKH